MQWGGGEVAGGGGGGGYFDTLYGLPFGTEKKAWHVSQHVYVFVCVCVSNPGHPVFLRMIHLQSKKRLEELKALRCKEVWELGRNEATINGKYP